MRVHATTSQVGDSDFGTKSSLQDAATQLKAAFQDLAGSYRNTFGQISCS